MTIRIIALLTVTILAQPILDRAFAFETNPITTDQQAQYLNHLLPLPKEISFDSTVSLKASLIEVRIPEDPRANEELVASILKESLGRSDDQSKEKSAFTILVGLLDSEGKVEGIEIPGADRLSSLPNKEQAYRIVPIGEDTLVLAALHPAGLAFGARTLGQLIAGRSSEGKVDLPLPEITDWPDLEERGVWNFPQNKEWIDWMSEMKLNYGNFNPDTKTIVRDEPNKMTLDPDLFAFSEERGFRLIPQIVHLNFLDSYGLFRAYPELAGLGDQALAGRYFAHKVGPQHRVPDASNPKLAEILAEWMVDIASQGERDICCWLTERPATDNRPVALQEGQFLLEARAFVQAWEKAKELYPDLEIRMFVSTTTEERYYKVYAELPPDMKIFRCCVTDMERVRHLPRDLFRNPLLDHYAEVGRWIGTYDVPLNVNGNVETPEFKIPHRSPQRIQDYVTQLVQRNYRAGIGMMAWHRHAMKTCGVNIAALAEWGWNSKGRSIEEFCLAWAMREGHENPEELAQWLRIMGPVEFDVFDSEFPICYSWGQFIDLIKEREYPVLSETFFRYYRTPDSFDEKIAVCDQAMEIAQGIEDPDYANETRVVRSYIRLAHAIYEIAELRATDPLTTLEKQEEMKDLLASLEKAGEENVSAIEKWRSDLGPEDWHVRVKDAVAGTEKTVEEIIRWVRFRDLY